MSLKYVLKVFPGFSKHFLKMKLANFKISKKKGKKYKPKTKIMLILGLFCRSVEILAKNISDSKTFNILLNVPQIKKKGKKYIKSTIILKIEIFGEKIFFTPFSATFFQRYFWYLLPFYLWRVYFWHFCTLLQDFDPFCGTIYPLYRYFVKISTKKNRHFLWPKSLKNAEKGVKRVKKGTLCTFPESTSFGLYPPKISWLYHN